MKVTKSGMIHASIGVCVGFFMGALFLWALSGKMILSSGGRPIAQLICVGLGNTDDRGPGLVKPVETVPDDVDQPTQTWGPPPPPAMSSSPAMRRDSTSL